MDGLTRNDPAEMAGYRMLARLGDGGMGRVFLARSPTGDPVAFKLIRPDVAGDAEFRSRFAREAEAARRLLGRPGIAAVLDADPLGPEPWLASEYVPGLTLHEAVFGHGPLPLDAVRALGRGLAEALTDIHASGLTHRDLKPSNIMLAVRGPRVIDFGIARAADAGALTRTGLLLGSPGFMAPEQVVGEQVGPGTDVFALGSVLVHALTGAGPYGDGPAAALLYRVVNTPPKLDAVAPELRETIERCLHRDPAERPSAAELAAGLAGEPPASFGGRLPGGLRLAVLERTEQAAALLAGSGPETEVDPLGDGESDGDGDGTGVASISASASGSGPGSSPTPASGLDSASGGASGTDLGSAASPVAVLAYGATRPAEPASPSHRRRILILALTPAAVLAVALGIVLSVLSDDGHASANGTGPSTVLGTSSAAVGGSSLSAHGASASISARATNPASPGTSSTPGAPADSASAAVDAAAAAGGTSVAASDAAPVPTTPISTAGVECSVEGPFTTSCASTNPELAVYQWNVSDTSACTFSYQLNWGDNTTSTVQVAGGTASSLYIDTHTYRSPGSYSVALTATTVSGSCLAVDFTYSYTYQ